MDIHYDVATNCLFRKIRTVSRSVTNLYTKSLKDIGITPIQYSMMTAIGILKSVNFNDLSQQIKMDRTTINRNLKPLIRDGFIIIKENSLDKREKLISLTKEGDTIYIEAYTYWIEAQKEIKELLGVSNWSDINNTLDSIIVDLE